MSEDQKPPHIRLGVANDQRELDRRNAALDLHLALKTIGCQTRSHCHRRRPQPIILINLR